MAQNMALTKKIIDIIIQAGEIISGAENISSDISDKEGAANFVTAYDVAVEKFLIENLKCAFPEASFLGEEGGSTGFSEGGYCFIIDPIDGTTNFIHNYRHSAVSVALSRNGEIIIGVVHNPYSGETFSAERGCGAYLNGAAINASGRRLCDALVSFGTSPYKRQFADETFELVKKLYLISHDIRRSGSAALDLCYIAGGRCDLFFEKTLSPWDYAAASLIIGEAGGVITSMERESLAFDKPSSVLAGNKFAYEDFFDLEESGGDGVVW